MVKFESFWQKMKILVIFGGKIRVMILDNFGQKHRGRPFGKIYFSFEAQRSYMPEVIPTKK